MPAEAIIFGQYRRAPESQRVFAVVTVTYCNDPKKTVDFSGCKVIQFLYMDTPPYPTKRVGKIIDSKVPNGRDRGYVIVPRRAHFCDESWESKGTPQCHPLRNSRPY